MVDYESKYYSTLLVHITIQSIKSDLMDFVSRSPHLYDLHDIALHGVCYNLHGHLKKPIHKVIKDET